MHIVWWYWICVGLFLLVAETVGAGGFYLLFIGIAALIVGAISLVIPTAWVQIVFFAVLSAVFIAVLRKPLVERVRKSTATADIPEFIGETARAVEPIGAGREGKIELRGSIWNARNSGTSDLPENAACTIVAREGIKMVVASKAV
jgi:membrane protein implicated in regulation of membrane protease activity